jgi:hypothetical protein
MVCPENAIFGRRIKYLAQGDRVRPTGNYEGMDDLLMRIGEAHRAAPVDTSATARRQTLELSYAWTCVK